MPEKGHCIQEHEVKCLCSLLTHDASIRSLARNGLLNSSTSASCKKHVLFPFPVLQVTAASLPRWDPEFSREQAGHHWGRIHPFILLLSFVRSVRMVGSWALNYPEGLCLLGCQSETKRNFSLQRFLVLFCFCFFSVLYLSNIARLLTHYEMTLCLKFSLKYPT